MNAPDLTFRQNTSPYAAITSLAYVQTKESFSGVTLPVNYYENSDKLRFRIYNNWALNTGIASALNVAITTFDGAGAGSHTALLEPVYDMWVHVYETGFGEDSSTPGLYTQYTGFDTPVGDSSTYMPERASDGTQASTIRAGTDTNGVGFIEFETYTSIPYNVQTKSYTFAITASYEWIS